MRIEVFAGCLLVGLSLVSIGRAEESVKGRFRTEVSEIRLEAREGLVFHPARAKALVGSRLDVYLDNRDPNDMPHNVCLVAPGKLKEVQQASLAIDSGAEARGFVPEHPAVLAHSKLIGAGESAHFSFALPKETRGIYYLVCTFPGHANVMYSALYVGLNPAKSLADDPEVSPVVRQREMARIAALKDVERPSVIRAIMKDTGAASILVALPGDLNYCWDANTCRLRYAWAGNFVNPLPHFDGNGSKSPVILGREFWRSLPGEAIGGIRPVGEEAVVADYLGYDLEEGIPTFRYRVHGTEVQERLTVQDGGLQWALQIADSSVASKGWRVLAPPGEAAELTASGGRRAGEEFVFSPVGTSPIKLTIQPKLSK